MLYLLATDTLIFLLRGLKIGSPKNEHQKKRKTRAQRSQDYQGEAKAFRKILTPFVILPYDFEHCPKHYGEVRWALEESGGIIGAMDLLIAAHALAVNATLVSNNTKHFRRVPKLKCENWT